MSQNNGVFFYASGFVVSILHQCSQIRVNYKSPLRDQPVSFLLWRIGKIHILISLSLNYKKLYTNFKISWLGISCQTEIFCCHCCCLISEPDSSSHSDQLWAAKCTLCTLLPFHTYTQKEILYFATIVFLRYFCVNKTRCFFLITRKRPGIKHQLINTQSIKIKDILFYEQQNFNNNEEN